jgi:hypothetical protein
MLLIVVALMALGLTYPVPVDSGKNGLSQERYI